MSQTKGVRALSSGGLQSASDLFAHPAVAALIGVLLGALLVLASRWASRFVTPDDAALGLLRFGLISFGRLILALAAMTLFFVFARKGFVAFSIALIVTFLCMLVYEAFKATNRCRPGRIG